MTIAIPPQVVTDAINAGTSHITRRMAIFEFDGTTPWYPEGPSDSPSNSRLLAGGSIDIAYGRDERRTLDCSMDNQDELLNPNPYGGFWYDKVLKAYKGFDYGTGTWECQVGEFVIDGMTRANFPSAIKIVGRDYSKRMANSKLSDSETFSSSTKLHDLVKTLGLNSSISKFKLPGNSPALGVELPAERGTPRWDIARDACLAKNYDLYFDARGFLCMTPFPDPALGGIEVIFQTGRAGNIASIERSTNDSELFNDIIVIGERPNQDNGLPYYGRATNTDRSSPTNIYRIGRRTMPPITLTSLSSDAEARRLARSRLKVAALESYEINLSTISYPWLDAGIVGEILDPDAADTDPKRYLIDSINLNLGLGASTATGKRVTLVGTVDENVDMPDPDVDPGDLPDVPDDPDATDPPTAPDPIPETPVSWEELRIATYNISSRGGVDSVVRSIENIMDDADIIGIQEGGDQGEAFKRILARNKEWGIWKGDSASKQSVAIFHRKSKGSIVYKKAYLAHDQQYVGDNGVAPATIKPKYVVRLDITLKYTGRRVTIYNTHMLASVTRSKDYLGEKEWNARRAHFTKHLTKLTDKLDISTQLVFGTGDYNCETDFALVAPLMSRVTVDHNYNTDGARRIDYVFHKPHNAISVISTKQVTGPKVNSDHDCAIVTYKVRI